MSYHEGSNWKAKKEDAGKPLYDNHAQKIEDMKDELANKDSLMEGYRQQIDQLNRKLEAEAERSSGQWISVEKQLPELTEPLMWYNDENVLEVGIENYKATVLAFHPQAGIYKAVLTKTTGWSEISTISNRALIPTHWRPLPEPPIQ